MGFCRCGPEVGSIDLAMHCKPQTDATPYCLFSLHTLGFIAMAITSTATNTTTHSAPVRRSSSNRPPSTLQLLRDTLNQDTAQPSPAPTTAHSEGASGPGFRSLLKNLLRRRAFPF
jgi:hypothetical protein